MKKTIIAFILFGVIILNASAQSPKNTKQVKVAEQFINFLTNQEFDKCWKLIDKNINSDLDKDKFLASAKELYETIPNKMGKFELYMNGVKFINGRQLSFYSFKYKNDISKLAPGYLIDIIFTDNKSTFIAGVQPKASTSKSNQASSSRGKETVITTNETWLIDSIEFKVRGVNLVHFASNFGIVAVQVEQVIPNNIDIKTWANQEGKKFAKYLYKQNSYSNSIAKAKELNIELLPEIGVSFIDPNTGQGYNTMIKSEDYK